ncbi:MAG: N-acetyltransferase [Lentisphaeria bacterium]|nr:N-acetyltransferase [Lentisphaeria bacterium]
MSTEFPVDVKTVTVRKAVVSDVDDIHTILQEYAASGLLLPRTKEDLAMRIGNFRICEKDGRFAGCAALRDYGDSLFEVRSLAVKKELAGCGIGSLMVSGILDMLKKEKCPCRVFALTYRAPFFCRLGFRIVEKELFPQKIWSDCSICPKAANCDETAVHMEIPAGV